MKYQNIMLTIIALCLIVITLFMSGVIPKSINVNVDPKNTVDVRIIDVGQYHVRYSLPVEVER